MKANNSPVAYRGVLVSLKPRKIPCIANETRTEGAPNDLKVKYLKAGGSIGESWLTKLYAVISQVISYTKRTLKRKLYLQV